MLKYDLLVNIVHFHLSLSECGTGSLETCTHVIQMPELHTALTITPNKILSRYFPPPVPCDENVAITGMCRLQGNVMKM